MNNALVAVIKSVLHTSTLYTRETSDSVARQIAQYIDDTPEVLAVYGDCGDILDIAESFTKDFVSELNS